MNSAVHGLAFAALAALAALAAGTAHANAGFEVFDADPAFPSAPPGEDEIPKGEWIGLLALGFNASSGNTDTSSLNSQLLLGYEEGSWRHAINLIGNRATDATGTIAERYQVAGKTDYKINDDDYVFVTALAERDRFAGIRLRTSQAVGYGRDLYKTERHRINGEVGVGARQVRYVDVPSENDAILRLAGGYLWRISDSSEFSQRLVVEAGSENMFTESITALKTNLIGKVYANLSFTVRHNDSVPEGREKTDTFTAIQLEYRF